MADDPPIDIRYEDPPAGELVSGRSVPNHIKYQMFIEHYEGLFGHSLSQVLSNTDHLILTSASTSFASFKSSEQSRIDHQIRDLCARRGNIPDKTVALEVDRIYSDSASLREQHFDSIVSRLSASGQAHVTSFVDETIANGMHTIIPPPAVQLQQEDAEEFDHWLDLECYRAATGDYPTEVRALSERATRQLREGKIGPTEE
jgi:hypothetical protein